MTDTSIEETKRLMGYMVLIINTLQKFKYECYAQANEGITMNWLMNHAPCNIDGIKIMCDVLKKYFPEIYQESGKSIHQMEMELKENLKMPQIKVTDAKIVNEKDFAEMAFGENKDLSKKIYLMTRINAHDAVNAIFVSDIEEFIEILKKEKQELIVLLDETDKYFPKGDKRRGEVLALLGILNAKFDRLIDKKAGKELSRKC